MERIKTMKKSYIITLHGCDDSTSFGMELTGEQTLLIKEMEKLADDASTYGCMPIMTIEEKT